MVINAMATDAVMEDAVMKDSVMEDSVMADAVMVDAEPAQIYDIIERDTVPAPAPRPDDSLQERIAELIKWLQPTDFLSPGNEFMKHRHSYVPGTGRWVQESAPFRTWAGLDSVDADQTSRPSSGTSVASNDRYCLHVRGVAGSGKSVFAANTVRQLQESGCIVLFFFFRQIVDKNHTARYLIRDFAAQLLPHCRSLVASLTALSQEHAVRDNELGLVWPAIVKALKDDEGARAKVFCVVDALDEMDDCDFEDMVEKLVALSRMRPCTARVMMTSRPLPHIERALSHPEVVRLKLDPALLSPDVARYVDTRMATLDPPLADDKKELVRRTICERANGLFLQARLMADSLAEGLREGRITEATLPDSLDRLPRTLRAVYEDMLKEHARRSGVTAEQQAKILMCVTHASRPLRLIELGSLLSRMLHVDLRRGKELVRAGCGRLLEILEDETVSVIHHSFTEFLHDLSRKDDKDAFPVLQDDSSHAMLAVLLLEYLDGCPHLDVTIDDRREFNYDEHHFSEEETARRQQLRTDIKASYPLASYATNNLFFHINKVPPATSADHLLEALDSYLVPGKPAFGTWILMNWAGPLSASFSIFHLITSCPGALTPVYVLEHFAEKEPALLDCRDLDGFTPLGRAAEYGYTDLAEALLARGADPTLGANDGLTPLHRAADCGHAPFVRLLLSAGVDPLIKTNPVLRVYDYFEDRYEEYTEEQAETRRETALHYAFSNGNEEVVKAFMPFIPRDGFNKCLHQVRSSENVRTILETGKADVDSFVSGATKLYRAARGRDLELIKVLIEHGADPNRRCDPNHMRYLYAEKDIVTEVANPEYKRGPTPLHAFVGFGLDRQVLFDRDKETAAECLRVLIEAGADVNVTMDGEESVGQEVTPLHLAVQMVGRTYRDWGIEDQSEETLTELLLSAGANPTAKTKNGNTPLHLINPEKLRLLEMLVEYGAYINALNSWGMSPLFQMISRLDCTLSDDKPGPDVKVFQRFLELGAEVDIIDEHGDTIFHHIMHNIRWFADSKFVPFIQTLLRQGADLNRRNKKGQPPLWRYRNRPIRSSRSSSSQRVDDEGVLRVLVDAGIELNSRDEEGRTILWQLLSQYGMDMATVEKFVRLGADPGALTDDGRTLLHIAPHWPQCFRYLISAGVRPDVLNKDGETIIHTVLRLPHTADNSDLVEVLDILVEAGVDPLAENARGQSALHVVSDFNTLEIVLNTPAFNGLDINEPDIDGFTPLHNAVAFGEPAVGRLFRAGVDLTVLAAGSLSPLHLAARSGEAGVIGFLLAQYRELKVLESHVNLIGNGRTPLHYACRSGSPEAVWTLLRNGADPRITDENGLTPLHALAEFDPPEPSRSPGALPRAANIVGMLQRAGADLSVEALVQQDNRTVLKRVTPLDLAVEKESWDMVRTLIAHGTEPRDYHKQSPSFALATYKEIAAEEARNVQASVPREPDPSTPRRGRGRRWRGRWAACPGAKMPLEAGTRLITGGQDILDAKSQSGHDDNGGKCVNDEANGADILHSVLLDGDYDTIKEYARLGGDMFEVERYRKHTFLHHLVNEGHAELLECFSDKVAEYEARNSAQEDKESGPTLLRVACERALPSLQLVQMLVERLGVDVNAVCYREGNWGKLSGATALHILAGGAYHWQVEALKYLLSKGADVEAKNKDGMTPLLTAIDKQHPHGFWREETFRALLRHGADINTLLPPTGAGLRGSYQLEISDQPGITKVLLEHGASLAKCPDILTRAIREWMEPKIVKLLLEAGLDPNELPSVREAQQHNNSSDMPGKSVRIVDGNTNRIDLRYALHEAGRPSTLHYNKRTDFKLRQQAVMDLLLSHGADAYAPYAGGSFVLQAIVEERGQVDSLLHGISRQNCNRRGHFGRTLLASACIPTIPVGSDTRDKQEPQQTVMPDVMQALVNAGADPLTVDNEGRTPLHWFCTFPGEFDDAHRMAFAALARHGPAAVQMADPQGRKPLHLALAAYACREQLSPFAIRHLLSVGADPVEPDPVTSNSALHFIAPRLVGESTAAAEAANLFRELANTHIDINVRNTDGETPIFPFAAAGWEATRDPTGKEYHPKYALAHDTTHAKALELFIDLGADLEAVDARKRTLLHVTAWREVPSGYSSDGGQKKEDVEGMFKRLMELGVDPRREDDELRTAIDVAVARDLSGIVQLFSEDGKKGMT